MHLAHSCTYVAFTLIIHLSIPFFHLFLSIPIFQSSDYIIILSCSGYLNALHDCAVQSTGYTSVSRSYPKSPKDQKSAKLTSSEVWWF